MARPPTRLSLLMVGFLLLAIRAAGAPPVVPVVLDDFDADLSAWTVTASDGVRATISRDSKGVTGSAMRLDYHFDAGAGYCVVRRAVSIDLAADYRFGFSVRADSPANNLEFKLIDPSGENVWWVNRRAFEFPRDWRRITYRKRHLSFAWGPSGGAPHKTVGFIEFAVAASSGGSGSVWLDDLSYAPIAPATTPPGPPTVSVSSGRFTPASTAAGPLDIDWTPEPGDREPSLVLNMGAPREVGGAMLNWSGPAPGLSYVLEASDDGKAWHSLAAADGSNGGRDWLSTPDAESARLRIRMTTRPSSPLTLRSIEVKGPEFSQSPNAVLSAVAADSPRGRYPRPFLGEQPYWTLVGVSGDANEALLSADGQLEVDKLGFSVEPFIRLPSGVLTWADVRLSQSLADGYLPIPTVTWDTDAVRLRITAFADGPAGGSSAHVLYEVTNTTTQRLAGSLVLAVRPFQVIPPWHELNMTGGVSWIDRIDASPSRIVVNGKKTVWASPAANTAWATRFAGGEVSEHLNAPAMADQPPAGEVVDRDRLGSGALVFNFDLAPGQSASAAVSIPLHGQADPIAASTGEAGRLASIRDRLDAAAAPWRQDLNRVQLDLPKSASRYADAFRSQLAYILINRDGPAIQPGSRTYERSWIRDGAITSSALLATGHAEQVREFLDWYAPFQFESGKIPCVVDSRGPDPVPEHDSCGEYIYAVATYYRFTGDRAFLERHLPRVVKAVEYLQTLRAQRMTPEYRDGPTEKRACYGLVPESISHEGYSAKPMHSYWDDFFTARGLSDAAAIAAALGRDDLRQRFEAIHQDFQLCLSNSIALATASKGIDFTPGCVELGDFDATSTSIAIWPCDQLGRIPEPQLRNTFDRYWKFFLDRRDGRVLWNDYTPYEARLIGAFVRLGQIDRAHALAQFLLADLRPSGWNQWGEIVWRDPALPRFVGDCPHGWVASEFINSMRSMFVYEREHDQSLVLCAGIPEAWLDSGEPIRIGGFPTEHGPVSYALVGQGDRIVLRIDPAVRPPTGGLVFIVHGTRPIRSILVNGVPAASPADRAVVVRDAGATVTVERGAR